MATRWKGKGSQAKALAEPMSKIVAELQNSLIQSESCGLLSGSSVILAVEADKTELLVRSCFGRPVVTCDKGEQWFQLGMEEAFFLCYSLKCLKIIGEDGGLKNYMEVWQHMRLANPSFPNTYKAYSHLRTKNWVVRPGSQYGVDFVAYRHHPSLVHSEFAVLVSSGEEGAVNERLRAWSDLHCTLRLCGSVAKTLLVIYVNKNSHGVVSPSCVEGYTIQEWTITRWSAEQNREDSNTN